MSQCVRSCRTEGWWSFSGKVRQERAEFLHRIHLRTETPRYNFPESQKERTKTQERTEQKGTEQHKTGQEGRICWGAIGSYIKGEDTAVIKACVEVGPGPGLVNGTWGAIADSDGDGEGRLYPGRPGGKGDQGTAVELAGGRLAKLSMVMAMAMAHATRAVRKQS